MHGKETVEFTNMCMVYDGDKVLVQDRVRGSWTGIAFPGIMWNRESRLRTQ